MKLLVPTPPSLGYQPDIMELESVLRALGVAGVNVQLSDSQGRERRAASLREAVAASGVLLVEAPGLLLVSSDAFFAFAGARCSCGADALVDIHEVYRRTHGGAAPARLLASVGLGRALRGRCACGERLDRSSVRSEIEAPFARFAVRVETADVQGTGGGAPRKGEDLLELLRRVTGPRYRAWERP